MWRLTGVSLKVFRTFPDGFPRYRESSARLGGVVNKCLEEKGLRETAGHSLYSLCHSFEDRMLAAGIDDRIRRDLSGHALDRKTKGWAQHWNKCMSSCGGLRSETAGQSSPLRRTLVQC